MEIAKFALTLGLVAIGTLCVGGTAGCSSQYVEKDGEVTCGGIADSSDSQAPKVIRSDNITKFSLRFLDDGATIRKEADQDPFPVGWYLLTAEPSAEGAVFTLTCDRKGSLTPLKFTQALPADSLKELAALIREKDLAAVNGSSKRNTALGTLIDLQVSYDSGEKITVYAEGGVSTVPYGWCGGHVFTEFFAEKLQARNRLHAPLFNCSYSRSNDKVGTVFSLKLESEPVSGTKRAILQKRIPDPDWEAALNGKGETKEVFVPKEKLEELEALVDEYPLKDWQDLPDKEEERSEGEDLRSIVFNYGGVKGSLSLDSDQDLPPEGQEALNRLVTYLENLAAEALS
ncbi:MAG: hypothetical protein IJ849_11855 [Selenomonadaceae bacterium]|nr:hypothetical protein [Selenomonadaceae bacterium]